MRPRPPECTDALLALLRSKRLLDDEALARLGSAWDGGDAPGPHIDQLVEAGLLTPFQAGHVREGRAGRLRLGPYRLVERLGRAVYRAEHALLGRTVVLKVLGRRARRPVRLSGRAGSVRDGNRNPFVAHASGSSTSEAVSDGCAIPSVSHASGSSRSLRSRREILAAGTLSHPHLVAAHDARWIRGRLVLVLEHVEGIDAARMLACTGPLPIDLVCRIATQTATALDYLHRRGLIHRDVKPANLLLSDGVGADAFVKLLDLGLICPTGTRGEELCGTPDYLPPERGHSPDAIDIRGDLYSLGCTLYELLAGRVPFPGGTWTGKLLRHRLEVPTPVEQLRPDVSPALAALVARLMERDPERRPASPAEVVGMLAPVGRAGTVSDGSLTPSVAYAPGPSRWPYLLAAFVGVVVGCLGKVLPPSPKLPPPAPGRVASGVTASTLDLTAVLASAPDGAVVELPDGEYRIAPIRVEGRSLTLRALPGTHPRLRAAGVAARWDALLSCDRDLTLEGIDLAGDEKSLAPLVLVEGGRLRLADCKLVQRGSSPAVSLRRGAAVEVRRCEVWASSQAVAVELGAASADVRLDHSRIEVRDRAGPALLLWCPEFDPAARAEVRLGDCDIRAGRVVACRCVGGTVVVGAERNRLAFHQALVSLDGCGVRDDCRRVLNYAGRANRHETSGAWLRLEGRPANIWTEEAWDALWPSAKPSGGEIDRTGDDSLLRSGVAR